MHRRFNPFPKKESHLNSLGKTVVAARVMLDVVDEKIDEKAATARLRREIGLNWSWINMIQFLSGKEAIGALGQLPKDWSLDGLTKADIAKAIIVAGVGVKHARPDGRALCASTFAEELENMDWEELTRELIKESGATIH